MQFENKQYFDSVTEIKSYCLQIKDDVLGGVLLGAFILIVLLSFGIIIASIRHGKKEKKFIRTEVFVIIMSALVAVLSLIFIAAVLFYAKESL